MSFNSAWNNAANSSAASLFGGVLPVAEAFEVAEVVFFTAVAVDAGRFAAGFAVVAIIGILKI
jgi:hypothetical protein